MTEINDLPSTPPRVHNGSYTITNASGSHFVVRLRTASKGALRGKRILSVHFPDENRFRGIAFWDDERMRYRIWRSVSHYRKGVSRVHLWWRLVTEGKGSVLASDGVTVEVSGQCVRCNGELTRPDSIRDGIGPVCAKKGGAR